MAGTLAADLWTPVRSALSAGGRAGIVCARILVALPRMSPRATLRALAHFGYGSLPLALLVAAIVGTTGLIQVAVYVQRMGARSLLGWAGSYAVLWEFGPLVLGLLLAARVGARNAAELATLQVGGQLEGLAGVSLDPYALLLAPRFVAMALSAAILAAVTFLVAICLEIVAADVLLEIPPGVFLQSLAGMLSGNDIAAGVAKVVAFALATGVISITAGISASGGARAVGQAAASAVVNSSGAIFLLDFALTPLLD